MSTRRAYRIVLALSCMVLPRGSAAQVAVMPGARVRVLDASSGRPLVVGVLVRLADDSATISTAATLPAAATPSVWSIGGQRHLEVSSPRRHVLFGIQTGMLVGALVGKAIARGPGNCTSMSGTCVGLFAGMLIGGIVGHRIRSESWQRVDYCLECVTIAPGSHGVLLGLSLAF